MVSRFSGRGERFGSGTAMKGMRDGARGVVVVVLVLSEGFEPLLEKRCTTVRRRLRIETSQSFCREASTSGGALSLVRILVASECL